MGLKKTKDKKSIEQRVEMLDSWHVKADADLTLVMVESGSTKRRVSKQDKEIQQTFRRMDAVEARICTLEDTKLEMAPTDEPEATPSYLVPNGNGYDVTCAFGCGQDFLKLEGKVMKCSICNSREMILTSRPDDELAAFLEQEHGGE